MSETQTDKSDKTYEEDGYDNPGIKGQLQYPEVEVDAERAGLFAAGKEDTLYEDDENEAGRSRSGWQNPADGPYQMVEGSGGDTDMETEPTENPDWDQNNTENEA